MREELVDAIFSICEADEGAHISSRRIYEISQQSMGMGIAANPYGGYRYAVGRDIRAIQWQRVYDLITRLWPEFIRADLQDQYRESVNRILAGYRSMGTTSRRASQAGRPIGGAKPNRGGDSKV